MLKLIDFEARNYHRFMLGMEGIKIKPDSDRMVIIGPNGSGKTSLLEIMAAYPPQAPAFHSNGYVRNKFTDESGNIFEMIADFSNAKKYQFLRNGDNLNEGGTMGVQEELMLEHLGIDSFVNAIATNQLHFHQLSPTKREEYLNRISGIDLTVAYKLFNEAKRSLRDTTGALKMLNTDLMQAMPRLIEESERVQMEDRLLALNERLTHLYKECYDPSMDEHAMSPAAGQRLCDEYEIATHELKEAFKNNHPKGVYGFKSREAYLAKEQELLGRIEVINNALIMARRNFDSLSEIYHKLFDNSQDNVENIEEEIQFLKTRLGELNNFPFLHRPTTAYKDPERTHKELEAMSQVYIERLCNLPPELSKKADRAELQLLQTKVLKGDELYLRYETTLNRLINRKEHIESSKNLHCPKCKYKWNPESSEQELTKINEEIEQGTQAKEALLKTQGKYKEKIAQIQTLLEAAYEVAALEKGVYDGENVFAFIRTNHSWGTNPNDAVMAFTRIVADVAQLAEIHKVQVRLNDLTAILNRLNECDVGGVSSLKGRMAELETEVSNLTYERISLDERLKFIRANANAFHNFEADINNRIERLETMRTRIANYSCYLLNNAVKKEIEEINTNMASLSESIRTANEVKSTVAHLKDSIAKQEARRDGFMLIIDELSPKAGLIAEQLSEFVNNFISMVNEVLSVVCSYHFRILPCKTNSESIDYVFPVEIADTPKPVDDIRNLSDGQTTMIKFAFKIVSLLCKGVSGIPLWVDEVDRELSPDHKIKMINYIRNLIDDGVFSQLFIISHHESTHGALPDYDVVDLSPIKGHPDYNKVAEIY